jgi:hypothetical protein
MNSPIVFEDSGSITAGQLLSQPAPRHVADTPAALLLR